MTEATKEEKLQVLKEIEQGVKMELALGCKILHMPVGVASKERELESIYIYKTLAKITLAKRIGITKEEIEEAVKRGHLA